MKKISFIVLVLISFVIISGCQVEEITPQNVDPIAGEIQSKYDQISAYESKIYSIEDSKVKFGLFAAIKPDKYKEIVHWEERTFLPNVEICNGNERKIFTAASQKITSQDYDCSKRVTAFFNIFDKIKSIANYKNTIKEIEVSKDDYKEVAYFAPNQLSEPEKWDVIVSSDNGYVFAERKFGNDRMPSYGIGAEGIEVKFTDDLNNQIRLVFLKNSYQLLKSEIRYPDGKMEISYYTDVTLNDEGMGMEMPPEESLKKMYE